MLRSHAVKDTTTLFTILLNSSYEVHMCIEVKMRASVGKKYRHNTDWDCSNINALHVIRGIKRHARTARNVV